MRDFSLEIYKKLLYTLKESGTTFKTFSGFLKDSREPVIMLRHDVDDRKSHSLEFARIQKDMGIVGTYYFRLVPQSFDASIIKEIHDMGHEIGYHYEDMDFAKGNPHLAIQFFEKHLKTLRDIVPIHTICMHGSPMSSYDNKDVWKHYDYKKYAIKGEPYFDINFKEVFYLTDTGRRWDGHKVSIRDKVENHFGLNFHTTTEIIDSIANNNFPRKAMFNFHPQRWTNNSSLWLKEKYIQSLKNAVKYSLIKMNTSIKGVNLYE